MLLSQQGGEAGGCLMLLSSRKMERRSGLVGLSVAEDRVEHVDLASGQGDEGLVAAFAFGSLAVVEGPRGGVALDGAERGLVEDAFEGLVAAYGALPSAWPRPTQR